MRASEAELTGAQAVSETKASFQAIGWAPIENHPHDLGTDLFVQASDSRREDLGLIVGVQVKGGRSRFKRPARDERGAVLGWWYSEEKGDHFDYWIGHLFPHLLVLRDLDSHVSYWVHVAARAVQPTGKGNKIFVPAHQIVDDDGVDDLLAVAAIQRPRPPLEGSAWGFEVDDLAPGQRYRYALLAPRLVAPHRNRGFGQPIGPVEAIALLAGGRPRDLGYYASAHASVPEPSEAATTSNDWGWRFLGALWLWMVKQDPSALADTVVSAPDATRRAAAVVARVCALIDREDHAAALQLLNEAIELDDSATVDWSWLVVQRGRLRAELGDLDGARSDALDAARGLIADGDDITSSAIAAASATLLWQTLEWPSGKINEVLTATDTTISWWRSQRVASALEDASDEQFAAWLDERTIRYVIEDTLHNGLFSSSLNAHLAGEHQAWRHLSKLVARHELLSAHANGDRDQLASALDDLRRSGDASAVSKAAKLLWRLGPLEGLAAAAHRVGEVPWTATTTGANLQLWAHGGDVLESNSATVAARFCLELLSGGTPQMLGRLRPPVHERDGVLAALSGVLAAADSDCTKCTVELLGGMHDDLADSLAADVAQVVIALPSHALGPREVSELRALGVRVQNTRLGAAILGRLHDEGDDEARVILVERAREGDLAALNQLSDVTLLDERAAESLLSVLAPMVEQVTANARSSAFSVSDIDAAAVVVVINAVFPTVARWDAVFELLLEPSVHPTDKVAACRKLAVHVSRLPSEVTDRLVGTLDRIAATHQPGIRTPFENSVAGSVQLLAMGLGVLDGQALERQFADLAMKGWEERRDLAHALSVSPPEALNGALAVLVSDSKAEVRIAAAIAAARRLVTGIGTEVDRAVVRRLAEANGALLAMAVLRGFDSTFVAPNGIDDFLTTFAGHRSARIRSFAQRIQAKSRRSNSTSAHS